MFFAPRGLRPSFLKTASDLQRTSPPFDLASTSPFLHFFYLQSTFSPILMFVSLIEQLIENLKTKLISCTKGYAQAIGLFLVPIIQHDRMLTTLLRDVQSRKLRPRASCI